MNNGSIKLVLELLKNHHEESFYHSIAVAENAKKFAIALDLDTETVDCIYVAGLLHDIGKVKIPVNILSANRKLTAQEYRIIQQHPYYGVELLDNINFGFSKKCYNMIKNAILLHHISNSDKCYPNVRERKTVYTDIISISDVYSALMLKRDYKEAFPLEKTIGILRNAGFNPILTEEFVKMIKREKMAA